MMKRFTIRKKLALSTVAATLLGALVAYPCAAVVTTAARVYAQDDPFADIDDESDPFADSSDSDPFGEPDASANTPFAPSALPAPAPDSGISKPVASSSKTNPAEEEELTPEEEERAKERAKYLRAEDVPDELKSEQDYFDSATPAERAVLQKTPTNAAEWFVAAVRVARVGRPNFAKILAKKSLEAPDASPEETATLLESLGAGRAAYFVANPTIGADGSAAYERVMQTAREYWRSDAALEAAFSRAISGSVSERAAAITDARKGGDVAVAALVDKLLSGNEADEKVALELLPFFEEEAVDALVAALRAVSADEIAPIADALAGFQSVKVAPELLARYFQIAADSAGAESLVAALAKQLSKTPSAEEFVKESYRRAREFYRNERVFANTVDGAAPVWLWDASTRRVTREERSCAEISRAEAAYWATTAYRVGESRGVLPQGAKALAIVAVAARESNIAGLDASRTAIPVFEKEFPNLSAQELVDALRLALETQRWDGALIPTILLQDRGDESLCYGDGTPSTIVQGATCPDRRVRYEALTAIVRWNPSKRYVGSSRVLSALEWFATSSGERLVVVASPKFADSTLIGRAFGTQGLRVVPATTGREALLAAQSSADVEAIFVLSTVSKPDIRTMAQALRGDWRTAEVPLLVGADDEREEISANLAVGCEPNAIVLATPRQHDAAAFALERLYDKSGVNVVAPEVRLAQSRQAIAAILQLTSTHPEIYELENANALLDRLLATPSLLNEALEFASTIKTPYAQTELARLAGDVRLSVEERGRVVDAFQRQLSANGSLLRGPDVAAMYDRYNASETEDVQTQRVLSRLLDVYEAATGKSSN